MKRSPSVLLIVVSLLSLILFFQNCSPNSSTKAGNNDGLSITPCQTMKSIFEKTYQPFVRKNCNNCHVSGGVGKGSFADSNFETSWDSFELAGYTRISDFSVN